MTNSLTETETKTILKNYNENVLYYDVDMCNVMIRYNGF